MIYLRHVRYVHDLLINIRFDEMADYLACVKAVNDAALASDNRRQEHILTLRRALHTVPQHSPPDQEERVCSMHPRARGIDTIAGGNEGAAGDNDNTIAHTHQGDGDIVGQAQGNGDAIDGYPSVIAGQARRDGVQQQGDEGGVRESHVTPQEREDDAGAGAEQCASDAADAGEEGTFASGEQQVARRQDHGAVIDRGDADAVSAEQGSAVIANEAQGDHVAAGEERDVPARSSEYQSAGEAGIN